MTRTSSTPNGKALLMRTLIWFLPMAALVVVFTLFYTQGAEHEDLIEHSAKQRMAVLAGKTGLEHHILETVRDLMYVRREFNEDRMCDDPRPYQVQDFRDDLTNLAMATRRYDQMRWIGKDGMERQRLDDNGGHPAFVPASRLQDKKGRYYVSDTLSLASGDIYISPLDLNIEHGKVERPYKPMIRVGTPVTDAHGHKCGIIVLNYLGKRMLRKFVRATSLLNPDVMLLNRDGYYLRSPHREDEWGFMFGRKDLTLAHRFPAAWQRISTHAQGQFMDASGLWTFVTVDIAKDVQKTMGITAASMRQAGWKVVTHLSHDTLFAAYQVKMQAAWTKAAGLLALLLLLSWRLAQASIKHDRLERALAVQVAEYQDLYDFAPCGYHSIDKDGMIIRVNQTELDWLGYRRDELIGKHFTVMHANPDHALIVKKLAAIEERRAIDNMEFDLRRKDGSSFPVSLSVTPVYDDDGRFLYSRSMLFDLRYRKTLEHRLEAEASHDPLTGLHNRRSFTDLAQRELSRARRLNSPLALMLLDIDFFKKINDRYGHDIGDTVLKSCSLSMTRSLRQIDIVARWGGEEFLALLPGVDGEQAMEAAERLRQMLASDTVEVSTIDQIHYSVSIGISSLRDDADSIEALIKRADNALYAAKQAGRNVVRQA